MKKKYTLIKIAELGLQLMLGAWAFLVLTTLYFTVHPNPTGEWLCKGVHLIIGVAGSSLVSYSILKKIFKDIEL